MEEGGGRSGERGRRNGNHQIWQISKRWSRKTNQQRHLGEVSACPLLHSPSVDPPPHPSDIFPFLVGLLKVCLSSPSHSLTLWPSPMTHPQHYTHTTQIPAPTLRLCFGKALQRCGMSDVILCMCACVCVGGWLLSVWGLVGSSAWLWSPGTVLERGHCSTGLALFGFAGQMFACKRMQIASVVWGSYEGVSLSNTGT